MKKIKVFCFWHKLTRKITHFQSSDRVLKTLKIINLFDTWNLSHSNCLLHIPKILPLRINSRIGTFLKSRFSRLFSFSCSLIPNSRSSNRIITIFLILATICINPILFLSFPKRYLITLTVFILVWTLWFWDLILTILVFYLWTTSWTVILIVLIIYQIKYT